MCAIIVQIYPGVSNLKKREERAGKFNDNDNDNDNDNETMFIAKWHTVHVQRT